MMFGLRRLSNLAHVIVGDVFSSWSVPQPSNQPPAREEELKPFNLDAIPPRKEEGAGSSPKVEEKSAPLPPKFEPPPPPPREPVIGILVREKPPEYQFFMAAREQPWKNYKDAVEANGGEAKLIYDDGRSPKELLKGLHGLLIPGGEDVHPHLYGAEADPTKCLRMAPDDTFDRFEIAMAQAAVEQGVPVRGICRGHQVLNVAFNGTLKQDIPSDLNLPWPYNQLNHQRGDHKIVILPGRLRDILGEESVTVTSFHHQAVGMVAPGFQAVALAADGIIEAIEMIENPTVIGVQFHPEKPNALWSVRKRFFESFTADAREYWDRITPSSTASVAPVTVHLAPIEAAKLLLARGYQFRLDGSKELIGDPEKVIEAGTQMPPGGTVKVDVIIPESEKWKSMWTLPTKALFFETILVEAGSPGIGTADTRKCLKLFDTLLRRGVTFAAPAVGSAPYSVLRSRMSMVFNLRNKTLLAWGAGHPRTGEPITPEELETWTNEPAAPVHTPFKKLAEKGATTPAQERLAALKKGLDALEHKGFEVRQGYSRALTPKMLAEALRDKAPLYVARCSAGDYLFRIDDPKRAEEFLYGESDQLDRLSPESRQLLQLVRNAKGVGGQFLTWAGGLKGLLWRKAPILFETEAVWMLQDGKPAMVFLRHPKQEYGDEFVESKEHLESILRRYLTKWKSEEPGKIPEPDKGSPPEQPVGKREEPAEKRREPVNTPKPEGGSR